MVPSVSVVIPAYNAAETIGEALASVQAQTFTDWEIVVVDDASPDATASTATDALETIPRARLIVLPENGGPARARNRGIAESRGEWIAFLDGDDAWLPWRLEYQAALAAEYPECALFCGGTASFEDDVKEPAGRESCELCLEDLAIRNSIATSTVLVRREALQEVGGFDEQFRGPEDFDLWLRILARHQARKASARLSRYRHVPGSLSMDDRKFLPEVLRVLDKAYGPAGALQSVPAKRRAVAFQYLCAAWMAADRRAFGAAWAHYLRGVLLWPGSFEPYLHLPWQRAKLFVGLCRARAGARAKAKGAYVPAA